MEKARLVLKIHGWVQGVFFRAEAVRQAQKLGVTGWVRNISDGTVEVVAEGEKDTLNKLYQWCQKGPLLSKVKKVDAKWESYEGTFSDFEIGG